MEKVQDYMQEFETYDPDMNGHCRIRVYRDGDATPVIVCSALLGVAGSIQIHAERIAGPVLEREGQPDEFIWVEHWPIERVLIEFQTVRFPRRPNGSFTEPIWTRSSREAIEAMVGQPID